MGTCLVCFEDIKDELGARAAACPTTTDAKIHGLHAYCHACFNAMISALSLDAIPLQCRTCIDPAQPQKAAVFFTDEAIMVAFSNSFSLPVLTYIIQTSQLALSDEARVRYVSLYKAKQPPGTVQIRCTIKGCQWTENITEIELGDVVHCKSCHKPSCRMCFEELKIEGQGNTILVSISRSVVLYHQAVTHLGVSIPCFRSLS